MLHWVNQRLLVHTNTYTYWQSAFTAQSPYCNSGMDSKRVKLGIWGLHGQEHYSALQSAQSSLIVSKTPSTFSLSNIHIRSYYFCFLRLSHLNSSSHPQICKLIELMKKSDNEGRATIRAYINLERVPVKRIRRVTLQLTIWLSNLRLEYQVPDNLKMAMKEDYQIFKRESSEFLKLFKSHWGQ